MKKVSRKVKQVSPLMAGKTWALQEDVLRSLASQQMPTIKGDFGDYLDGNTVDVSGYDVVDGVAVIQVVGIMQKYPPSPIEELFGLGGASTLSAGEAFAQAEADPIVASILIIIDSPGGQIDGTGDLAQQVANSSKPTTAFISDTGGSAAYWLASQADTIYANPTALVGSIGVYSVIADTSRLYEGVGIKVNLVKAGESKGGGVDGLPITDDYLADVQRLINGSYELFIEAVAQGRGMTQSAVRTLATGQVWLAAEATKLGLIDAVDNLENTLTKMKVQNMASKKIYIMKAKTETPVVEASLAANSPSTTEAPKTEPQKEIEPVADVVAAVDTPAAVIATAAVAEAVNFDNVIAAAKAGAYAAGMKAEQDRFASLSKMAKNHPAFAIEQYRAGADLATAASAYGEFLAAQAEQAKTLDPSNGTARLSLRQSVSESTGDPAKDWERNVNGAKDRFKTKAAYVAFETHKNKIRTVQPN